MAKKIRYNQVEGLSDPINYALDSNVVHQTGDENMHGAKRMNSPLIKIGDGVRIIQHPKSYYYNSTPLIGAIVVKLPNPNTALVDVELSYQTSTSNNSQAKIRVTGYFASGNFNTSINNTATVVGSSSLLPFINIIKLGKHTDGSPVIILGDGTTNMGSYLSVVIEKVTYRYASSSSNATLDSGYEIIGGVTDFSSYSGLVSCSVEINTSHANKAFLDVINQNLGTTHTPNFNGIIIGQGSTSKGFNASLPFAFLNAGAAQLIYTGGVLASNAYADAAKIPTNGIYSKGNVLTSGGFIKEGGAASQFLKADGTVDSNSYALASHNHNGVYDNYQSWNLKTNGIQRTTVQSGGILDLVNGSNVNISYSAGGVVTINAVDTTYSNGNGLALSSTTFSIDPTILLDIASGKEAHGWGNHASAGYALSSQLANYLLLAGGQLTGNLSIRHNLSLPLPTHEFKTNQANGRNDFYLRSDSGNHIFRFTADNNHFLFDIGGGMSASNQTGFPFLQIPAYNSQFRVGYYATQLPAYMSAVAGHSWTGGNMDAGGDVNAGNGVNAVNDVNAGNDVNVVNNVVAGGKAFTEGGFVHNQYDSPDVVLVSNGEGIHKKDLIFTKVLQTVQDFEYIDIAANVEFREYQVIVWNDAATINIPAASSDIMGMKIVIKLEQSTPIYNFYPMLEVDGRPWGTLITNNDEGVELVCRGDSWVSTLIGRTMEIVL
ncbi:MAG: hypothetical protein ABS44_11905 [Chryseobacterium sp. SCN 40-13]|nr:MAG: hypothetical protein ABS44_11905 [Chryseobacterium sp. SCN 40-13]